jgi:tape measure domain-containing protein
MARNLDAYKLAVIFSADAAKVLAALKGVDVNASKAQASLDRVSASASATGRTLTLGLTAPVTAFGYAAIRTATQMDSLTRGLRTVAGSAEATQKQLVSLREVAKLPGLGFKEAVQGSINLQAAGFNAELAERSLKAFGNALATVGKGKSELDGVILALGQIESKGKVSAEEINQLAERVPQIRKAIIAAFGTADTEVLQKSKLTARQFVEGVVTQLEKLPAATGGAQNSFENLSDTAEQAMSKIGTAALKVAVPALDKLAPKIEAAGNAFDRLSPEAKDTALALGVVAIAAGPVLTVFSKVTALLSGATAGAIRLASALSNLAGGLAIVRGLAPGLIGAASGTVAVGAGALIQSGGDQPTVARAKQRDLEIAQRKAREAESKRIGPRLDAPLYQTPGYLLPSLSLPASAPATAAPANNNQLKGLLNAPTGKTGGGGGRSTSADARTYQEALAQAEKDGIENRLRIEQAGAETRALLLENSYKDGKRATSDYYRELATSARAGVQAELDALAAKRRVVEQELSRTKPGTADAVRLQSELGSLDTETYLKLSEGIRAAAENTQAFKDALGGLGEVDLSPQVEAVAQVPDLIARATARIEELSAKASQYGVLEAELDRDRERIQTQVAQGTLTEKQAKGQLIALEASYRDELIATLEAKKEMAGLDAAAVASLDAQIERVKRLGIETAAKKERSSLFGNATLDVGAFGENGGDLSAQASGIEKAMAGLRAAGAEIKELGKGAFADFASGLGGIVEQFVLTGETGPGAMKKLAAGVLASLAAQAAVKSLFYLAEGIAAATNPFTAYMAPGYFAASAVMAGIAGGAAVAGRAVAGKGDKGQISAEQQRANDISTKTSSTYAGNNFERRANGGAVRAGRAYLVGEHRPEVVTFGDDGYVHSSMERFQQQRQLEGLRQIRQQHGGNGALNKLIARLEEHMSRLEAVDSNEYVLRVVRNNPRTVGRVAVDAVDADDQLGARLGRRIAA